MYLIFELKYIIYMNICLKLIDKKTLNYLLIFLKKKNLIERVSNKKIYEKWHWKLMCLINLYRSSQWVIRKLTKKSLIIEKNILRKQ